MVAAERRTGGFHNTGFDLHLRRPQTDLGFWRVCSFGQILRPCETVVPASLLRSAELAPVFDGSTAYPL